VNDLAIPQWIKERKNTNALREARLEADKQRQIADSFRIQKDAPNYSKTLFKELARNTDALPDIGFQGNTVPLPSLSGETSCRVLVSVTNIFPKQDHTDVFIRNHGIDCYMLNGGVRRYYFCVEDGAVGVLPETPDGQVSPLTAESLAELIVKRMVDYLGQQ
jgi:hypothetical protein